jgi:predicted XRE-type DNA-binding protein
MTIVFELELVILLKRNTKIIMNMKKNKDFNKLTEEEIIARLDSDNYEGGNIGLPEHPTLEERTKYQLCKSILSYQLKNEIPLTRVAEKLAISEEEIYDICRGKIADFSLTRLMFFLEKLTPNYELLVIDKERKESRQA